MTGLIKDEFINVARLVGKARSCTITGGCSFIAYDTLNGTAIQQFLGLFFDLLYHDSYLALAYSLKEQDYSLGPSLVT